MLQIQTPPNSEYLRISSKLNVCDTTLYVALTALDARHRAAQTT